MSLHQSPIDIKERHNICLEKNITRPDGAPYLNSVSNCHILREAMVYVSQLQIIDEITCFRFLTIINSQKKI